MSETRLQTSVWQEHAETDDPFVARTCHVHGYEVYGEVIYKSSWAEFIYLLFRGERPAVWQAQLLEKLAIALANPGPREASVRAAMCAGVGGSTAASMLMAALAVGAGQLGGGHELFLCMQRFQDCDTDLLAWQSVLKNPPAPTCTDIWPEMEYPAGFHPHAVNCPLPVQQSLALLAGLSQGEALPWLQLQRQALEKAAGSVLSFSGVAAAALIDLGFNAEQAELLYLWLRLPGAAVHGLEQKQLGWKKFPFATSVELTDDPGAKGLPDISELLP